ncbi:hypothetical protein AB1N83_011774, partial [Pleurotus pulmonarius]
SGMTTPSTCSGSTLISPPTRTHPSLVYLVALALPALVSRPR